MLKRRSEKEKSKISEARKAKDLKMTLTPQSGAGFLKNDMYSREILLEQKDTAAKSYTLKIEDLKNLYKEASKRKRVAVFNVNFKEHGESVYMIDELTFKLFKKFLEENYE